VKIFTVVIGLLALAASSAALVLVLTAQGSDARQITQLRGQLSAATQQIQSERSEYERLRGKVADLNVPTDPLSAYNQVCNQDNTDSNTGVTQLYYYPCTNGVVPAPGY
jgi:type II secretory pathway pseudopilin PulG